MEVVRDSRLSWKEEERKEGRDEELEGGLSWDMIKEGW